ncbi:Ectonucleoside triphosphate diphosphohydrolase 3 [Cichlidogyrus casuarinus]|uniref:Ectonucleoside triphosphate diphosphohydrolase 3 n=1 Tax=Cichlidogyrus casuarinus TaxID=1844966 RepID=A0ABD2QBB2_9PLAT
MHKHYAVVIDAGSTSSKVNVYSWKDFPFRKQGYVEQVNRKPYRSEPGISSYLNEPSKAYFSLESILSHAIEENIPSQSIPNSNVYLAATAGMRIALKKNKEGAKELFQRLRSDLKNNCPLQLQYPDTDVRLLSGEEEGVHGWITANYLNGSFGMNVDSPPKNTLDTAGALDMGGASTQITFVVDTDTAKMFPHETIMKKQLYKNSYHIYSRSLLCNGKNEFAYIYRRLLVVEALESSRDPVSNFLSTIRMQYDRLQH